MESEFTITTYDCWKNTIRSVEAAYYWLTTYKGENFELVEESVTAMRKLLTHGKDYEAMKNYKSQTTSATTSTIITTPQPSYNNKKNNYNYAPISYDLEPHWQQIDDNTIHVNLGEGRGTAIAIAVTTEEQLDQVVKDIYAADCVAVDCEFLGMKKALPELKLLQIGVSAEKGYAIQVDVIGLKAVTDKLKPILEDPDLHLVGWSFRSDALAIESFIKNIELAPVLDLQAKLKPIAVETLNLAAAMNKYAAEWSGNDEFQRAKQYGNEFIFTGDNCVWLNNPLPPKALVYAVFDVLSVVALDQHTRHYTSAEHYYWPMTVTSGATPKAIEKWHRQRVKGINSSSGGQGVVGIVKPRSPNSDHSSSSSKSPYSTPKSRHGKEKEKLYVPPSPALPMPQTDDGYDDNDERFQRDIQAAIENSVKEVTGAQISFGESSRSADRVVLEEELDYSSIAQDLGKNPYNRDIDHGFFDEVPVEESTTPEIIGGTWGTEVLDEQPFIGGKFQFNKSTFDYEDSPSNSSPQLEQQQQRKSTNKPPVGASPATQQQSSNKTSAESSYLPPQHPSSRASASAPPYKEAKQLYKPPQYQRRSNPTPSGHSQDQNYSQRRTSFTHSPRNTYQQPNGSSEAVNSQWSTESKSQWGNASSETTTSQWNNTASESKSLWNNTAAENTSHWGSNDADDNQTSNKWSDSTDNSSSNQWVNVANNVLINRNTNYSGNLSASTSNQWSNASGSTNQWNNNAGSSPPSSRTVNRSPRVPEHQLNQPSTASRNAARPSPHLSAAATLTTSSPSQPQKNPTTVSNTSSPQQQSTFKPDKGKYTNEMKNRITVGNQGGVFTWSQPLGNEMSAASWSSFVSSTISDWKQGKDTDLDAIANSPAAGLSAASTPKESIKFNTTVQSHYPHGGKIGDSSAGKMNAEEVDNWSRQEERPDTMQMAMNQIPSRKEFSGPRIMNPDDDEFENYNDEDDDDDEDDYIARNYDDTDFPILKVNMSIQDNEHKIHPKTQGVEDLPIFVDGIFLYGDGGNAELSMLKLNAPEHLDMINIPPPRTDYTVTICYHFVSCNQKIYLKALQLYLSTGESYTAIIEQACLLKFRDTIKNTKFGRLLTDPSIKRVCWVPDYIEDEMEHRLGFKIGRCVDLSLRANCGREDNEALSFINAIDYYLKDWPDKNQFTDAKRDFEALNYKKFSSTCWDREKLPGTVLSYCALQGLAAYSLYLETLKTLKMPDDPFLYNTENK